MFDCWSIDENIWTAQSLRVHSMEHWCRRWIYKIFPLKYFQFFKLEVQFLKFRP